MCILFYNYCRNLIYCSLNKSTLVLFINLSNALNAKAHKGT